MSRSPHDSITRIDGSGHFQIPNRQLSPVEKIFWRLTQGKSLNVSSVAGVQGPLSMDAVIAGLKHLAKLHPLARVRIDKSGEAPRFVTAGVADIPLRRVKESDQGIESILEHEINVPIDTRQGPLVRCTWAAQDSLNHSVFMTFHHAVGDGMSGVFLLRDFLRAAAAHVSGDPLPTATASDTCGAIDLRLPCQTKGLRGGFGLARLLGQIACEDAWLRPPTRPYSEVVDASLSTSANPSFKVHCRDLESGLVSRITEHSRKNRTTVHGALSAAICLAIAQDNSPTKAMSIKHRSPVNMRTRLDPPAGEELGMFASMSFFRARLTAKHDFWSVARQVRRSIEAQISRHDPARLIQLMPQIYRLVGGDKLSAAQLCEKWQQRTASTSGLTNLGRVEFASEFEPFRIGSIQFAVAPGALGDFACTATTYRQKLCWNFIYATPHFSPERVTRIADNAMDRLLTATGP